MLNQLCQLALVAAVGLVLVTSPWCGITNVQAAPLQDERSAYCQDTLMQTFKQRTDCYTAAQKYVKPSPPVFLLMCCLGTVDSIRVDNVYTDYLDLSLLEYILDKLSDHEEEKNMATFVHKCHKIAKVTRQLLTIVDYQRWVTDPNRPCLI